VLRRGTASIVASVVPVPDDGTARLMSALHGELRAGAEPAPALAAAAQRTGVEGFVCLGAG
jgi:CHAT domain-containing protein